ncbi:MAG: SemiSWEET transporter [Dehalococcoidia bacterium]|nr:SemiSWEET transporter [Dehalococcoidia bacterium]
MSFKIIGIIAAIFTTASFVPQAVRTIRTKDTSGISLAMYILFTTGVLLWLLYGIYISEIAIILANSVTFVLASVILAYTIRNNAKRNQ